MLQLAAIAIAFGTSQQAAAARFTVGEVSEYSVRVAGIRVGTARLSVDSLVVVRGIPVYQVTLRMKGGIPLFSLDDVYQSWIDTSAQFSVRYWQLLNQTRYKNQRHFEIYPERPAYSENGGELESSVPNPLDELAFLFFIRTQKLEVGQTYRYDRYFRPERNPVFLEVKRRASVRTEMGTFDCLITQPRIPASRMFSAGSAAEVAISTGPRRDIVQIRSRIAGFSVVLTLSRVEMRRAD
mgnify:CR=1 FL=1